MWIFVSAECVLYTAIFFTDNDIIKYCAVALCLIAAIIFCDKNIIAAMAFTLAADTFLLLLNKYYAVGLALFCVVQSLYFVRIYNRNGKSLWGLRLILLLISILILYLMDLITVLNTLSAIYFTTLICNIVQSMKLKELRLFSLGLILFICCDICVGIYNSPDLFSVWLTELAASGMWIFYPPSQVIIVLSGRRKT